MINVSGGGKELLDAAKLFERIGLKAGHHVADLGCGGSGHFVIPAARLVGNQGAAYAVDILKSVLQTVASKARLAGVSNIKTVWANLEVVGATSILKGSLDAALLINTLFQSKKYKQIMQESARLVKPGGKLVVVDWSTATTALLFGPPKQDRVDPALVKNVAQELGLSLVDEFDAGVYHFGLIFQKR